MHEQPTHKRTVRVPTGRLPRWQRLRAGLVWYGKRYLALEAAIVAAALGVCLLGGYHSVPEITMGLTVAGALILAVGPAMVMGGWENTRGWSYLYARTMEDRNHVQRASQDNRDMDRNMGVVGPSFILGGMTILIALIVQLAFE